MCGFMGTYELSINYEGPEDTSKESTSLTETEGEWSNNMYTKHTERKKGPGRSYGEFRVERVIAGRTGQEI